MDIDLNSDLGESFGAWRLGDDDTMLGLVTSANVACGFHAGDARTMRRACETAVAGGVAIGAHVAYRDLAGFGRRFIDVDPAELSADVLYQLGAIDALARAAGGHVAYVKPHGSLYNTIVHHEEQAAAVVEAMTAHHTPLPALGLPGARWLELAEQAGLPTYREAFADRAYADDGTLVPRGRPGSVLHDPEEVADRMLRLVHDGVITSIDGNDVEVRADSLCVHSDSPGAVEMATTLRRRLDEDGVRVRSFVGTPG